MLALFLAAFFSTAACAVADTAPTVSLDPASSVSYTSAHLSGHVNPNGGPSTTSWELQYAHDPEFEGWHLAASGQFAGAAGEETSPLAVAANLSGLTPGAEYFFRLLASNDGGGGISAEPDPTFTTVAVDPPAVSIAAPSAVTTTSAHFSGEINPGGTDPGFAVHWHFQCNPGCPGLEGDLAAGATPQPVSADASALTPKTLYEVSLIAENADSQTTAGPEPFTTVASAPGSITGPATDITPGAATLRGTVNPNGSKSAYHFEYGTSTSYGSRVPAYEVVVGEGQKPISAEQEISGLQPNTVYHFRLVAENSVGKMSGEDATFTTSSTPVACANEELRFQQASTFLPSCRAYELVSPAQRGNVPLELHGLGVLAGDDGNHLVYTTSRAAFPDADSATYYPKILGSRSAGGWGYQSIDSPVLQRLEDQLFITTLAVSADFNRAIVVSGLKLTSDAIEGEDHVYIRDLKTNQYTLVFSGNQGMTALSQDGLWYGGSDDLHTFSFLINGKLYEWRDGVGLQVASVLPDGTEVGSGQAFVPESHLVSRDGSRVFFDGYVRVNGTETLPFSPAAPESAGRVLGASPDGRYVEFFSGATETVHRTDLSTGIETDLMVAPGEFSRADPELGNYYMVPTDPVKKLVRSHEGTVTTISPSGSVPLSLSPNGRYLVYSRKVDSSIEVYRYDALDEASICLSCRVDGGPSLGPAAAGQSNTLTGRSIFAHHMPLAVLDDGTTYFDTPNPLVKADTNGTRDVYVFHDGVPELISPGWQPSESRLIDVTPDGANVFFSSGLGLVGEDQNGIADIYDARVGGGFASQNILPVSACAGESCRSETGFAPPPPPAGGSESLEGPGNRSRRATKHCRRGQRLVKAKGGSRCVKAPKRNAKSNRRQGR